MDEKETEKSLWISHIKVKNIHAARFLRFIWILLSVLHGILRYASLSVPPGMNPKVTTILTTIENTVMNIPGQPTQGPA